MDDESEVPSLFLCPISLQLMRDPVTLCTGITYDRQNIEKWLFSCNKNTCPVTNQPLLHTQLTPNHTLQSFIQTWCTSHNASFGVKSLSTPNPSIHKSQVVKLLLEAKKFPERHLNCLQRLQSIAFGSESNRNYLESLEVIDFLASTMTMNNNNKENSSVMREAAIEVLYRLNPSESQLKILMNNDGIQFVESLFFVLKCGNNQSRTYATILLKSAFEVAGPTQLNSVGTQLFVEIVRVLRDMISVQASKAALKFLVKFCSFGKNRIKAIEVGAVLVLIELLIEESERRVSELILIGLDKLCGCAEGRAELLNHGAGVAIVSKKILRVSHVASDRGVKILNSICRHSATPRVLNEMLLFGAVTKLCLVLQVEGSFKAKERARETLQFHSIVWRNSPCIPAPMLASYP